MAAELGLVSLTQHQKLAQSQDNNQDQEYYNHHQLNRSLIHGAWMWNPKQAHHQEDEDSWEVRAFAEDTGNVMGTTWPPRSYTCTFCRREFRSAQALGGHMNVHRRDRARLHHQVAQPNSIINPRAASPLSTSSTTTSSFLIPAQEFVANGGGLCLLYQFPSPNGGAAFPPTTLNACTHDSSSSSSSSPSTLLSISPYTSGNMMMSSTCSPPTNFPVGRREANYASDDHQCESNRAKGVPPAASTDNGNEELDLELRLGHGPTPTC